MADRQTEYAVLLGLGVGAAAAIVLARRATPSAHTGIDGMVTEGPMCPVESVTHPCPDAPLAGVLVRVLAGGTLVAEARTDAAGHFQVLVPPGTYQVVGLSPQAGGIPRPPAPVTVTVMPGIFTPVSLRFDTAIR